MNIPEIPNRAYLIKDTLVVRLRQSVVFIVMIATIIYQHEELLQWEFKSMVKLLCLIILGLNGAAVSRKRDND